MLSHPLGDLPVVVADLQLVTDSETVVAKFTLTIAGQLTIYGGKLLKRRGRPPWVVLPSRPIVEAYGSLRATIEGAVLDVYDAAVHQPSLYSSEWRSS